MTNAKQSIEIIEGLTVELTAEQLEEVSRKLQSAKDKAREELSKPEFKIGDIVVITDNTNHSANKVGDIGIIEEIPKKNNPIVAVPGRKSGKGWSHTKPEEMRLATAEEIAKYEKALKPKVKIGDWIRAIGDGEGITDGKAYEVFDNTTPGFARVIDDYGNKAGVPYGDFEITEKPKLKVGDWIRFIGDSIYAVTGKAYKVIGLNNGSPRVIDEEGTPNTFFGGSYEIIDKLTPFDRAGRKPGEFKKGDIVRVVNCVDEHKTGDLRIIHSAEAYAYDYGLSDPNNEGERLGFIDAKNIELVTPVENRVDIAEGADVA